MVVLTDENIVELVALNMSARTCLLSVLGRIVQFATMSNAKYCAALAVALYLSLGEAAAQSRKIVIDCDPGIDDAMAIVLAMQYSGFEIIGISTGFGNAYVDQATQNALTVVDLSGRTIPVYRGAATPRRIAPEPPPDFVHGKDGLGNTTQPRPKSSPQSKSAAQFLVDTARSFPGQITLVAIGRLTNLADAIRLDTSFTSNLREVVLMGGAFHVPGNVSPVAEANISGDPDAADIVLTAPWEVTMLALNTTTKVKLSDEILLRIRDQNDRYGQFIWSITRFYMDFHKNVNHVEGGFYVHDPSAIMFLIDPSLFTIRKGPVRVVTDGIALGETIMPAYDYQLDLPPWRGRPAVTTATDVDVKRFLETFESVMTRK
jgi:uridine nucleosidase